MDINPQWITLVFACNAMIASIAGAFVNTRVAKTQFNANMLSVNRQKWIETMRDCVASPELAASRRGGRAPLWKS